MTGRIPAWWENYHRGKGKTAGTVENFPQDERKCLPVQGTFSTAASVA
jgi:hypothetical protein